MERRRPLRRHENCPARLCPCANVEKLRAWKRPLGGQGKKRATEPRGITGFRQHERHQMTRNQVNQTAALGKLRAACPGVVQGF
jgi:hypothetical protein